MRRVMVTERLTLRQLELYDAEAIEKLAGEKEVADTTVNMPHPYPSGSANAFIQARHEAADRGDGYSFAVTLTEGEVFLGGVGLHLNKNHNMAELARHFEEDHNTSNPHKRLLFEYDYANPLILHFDFLHHFIRNRISRHCCGNWIGKPYWKRGYCTEAFVRVIKFAFDELGLKRV